MSKSSPLKIGELAKKTGLSIRALHHYDAIGLLCPSQRSEGGARLYSRDDIMRLHRIEALKQLDYSLADIKAALDDSARAPLDVLARQIAVLDAQALQAQRLSRRLQHLLDLIATGGETAATDWLDILELMNMYQKHLSDDELSTLMETGPGTLQPTDIQWTELVAQVREAMAQALPADSGSAQALAWRWIRLVILMTRNDPALADKILSLQMNEPRAQVILGITPAMLDWIAEAFAHARCALLAKYMSPAQIEETRRRQLAHRTQFTDWPALVAELRAQMEAGTEAGAPAVQAIVKRWQQLFRDSYCGDDAALEARVREAFMREPDLRLGVGVDDALLVFLQKAHMASHHAPQEGAGPKPSAMLVAMQRAAHQLIEHPLVLDDPLALTILGKAQADALRSDLSNFRGPMAQGLRSSVVVRSRVAEDEWVAANERGVRQYIVLGAGLDTSAYRHAARPGRIFEVDLPATQAWKRARLAETGIAIPQSVRYVPVDFETVSLAEGLAAAGFDASQPAFFSWLGVTMYLDESAVLETLRFIASCAKGSAVLLEYVTPLASLSPMMRIAMEQMASQLAARGEPWKSFFEPEALAAKAAALGFSSSRTWSPQELNDRYLANRKDGLHIGPSPGRLMLATV
jgi:methyltransferase (TIGR00027 family)